MNTVRDRKNKPVYSAVKRFFDILFSFVFLIILSPLFLIILLAVCLESSGNPIFKQRRVGKGGKEFTMFKFRSMYQDAEARLAELRGKNEMDDVMFKMEHDPRVTRVGHWLRKSSLDELPQLINILNGSMSFVGPRPPLPSEVEQYTPEQRHRLDVKGGLTGWWQVHGRSTTTFAECVRLDMEYIEKRSLWLDLKIIFLTVPAVLHAKGAY